MQNNQNISAELKRSGRLALRTYAAGAAIVYTAALSYCIATEKYTEAAIVGGVMTVIAVFIAVSFRKI